MGTRGNGNPFSNVENKDDLSVPFNSGQRTAKLCLLEAMVWNTLLTFGLLS